MTAYPRVLGESDTLERVLAGASLARYGDGEFALCRGRGIPCQAFDHGLQARLRGILKAQGRCLVGIPNLDSPTPKAAFWERYRDAADVLGDQSYVSAFVSRPDSAPWIDTPAYWQQVEQLWRDHDVLLVRGGLRSFTAADLSTARSAHEITAPRVNAWSEQERLRARIEALKPSRVLLCLGPTATVLAVDLCAVGIHAIDIGHLGMFWHKHQRGEPMIVTEADKAA